MSGPGAAVPWRTASRRGPDRVPAALRAGGPVAGAAASGTITPAVLLASATSGQVLMEALARLSDAAAAAILALRDVALQGPGEADTAQEASTLMPTVLMVGGLATLAMLIVLMYARTETRVPPDDALAGPPAASATAAPAAWPNPASAHDRPRPALGASIPLDVFAAAPGPDDPPQAFQRGRAVGQRWRGLDMDGLFDHMTDAGLGSPQLLRQTPRVLLVRLDPCPGCSAPAGPGANGCSFEAGFLEGALCHVFPAGVVVRETQCRRHGGPACDFEVWH